MAKKSSNPKHALVAPDLKLLGKLKEEFLQKKEFDARKLARWELNVVWTEYRMMKVRDLHALDPNDLPVSDAIVVRALKEILITGNITELNKLYDRILGKPKETKDEKLIDDVSFTINLLENSNDNENLSETETE